MRRAAISLLCSWLLATAGAAQEDGAAVFCGMQYAERADRDVCIARQMRAATGIDRYLRWVDAEGGDEGARVMDVILACRDRWAPDLVVIENCIRARALIPPP